MAGQEETFFIKRKEGPLFYHVWAPEQPPKAVICLIHELGDHSGCFLRFISFFTSAGFAVAAVDLYGHGRSCGRRGDAPRFSLLLDEAIQLVNDTRKRFPHLPLFLYGHSMGGNIVLNTSLRYQPAVSGVVASAPWLEMVAHPVRRAVLARAISLVHPTYRFNSGLHPEGLSHDADFAAFYMTDPLVHGFVSARLFWQASSAGRWVLRHAGETRLPTLVIHGEADPITSAAMSKQYAAQSGGMADYRGFWGGSSHLAQRDKSGRNLSDGAEMDGRCTGTAQCCGWIRHKYQ